MCWRDTGDLLVSPLAVRVCPHELHARGEAHRTGTPTLPRTTPHMPVSAGAARTVIHMRVDTGSARLALVNDGLVARLARAATHKACVRRTAIGVAQGARRPCT